MASRTFFTPRTLDNELIILPLVFTTNDTSNPSVPAQMAKYITSIVRNGAGDWTVTLKDTYNAVRLVGACATSATLTSIAVQGHTITTSSVRVALYDANVAADGGTTTEIGLMVACRNSSIT